MSGPTHRTLAATLIVAGLTHGVLPRDIILVGHSRLSLILCLALGVGASVMGATLPDLELRHLPRHPWVGRVFPHRGPTHSLLGIVLAGGTLATLFALLHIPEMGDAFLLGWLSHALLDSLLVPGVALFWPRPDRIVIIPSSYHISPTSERLICFLASISAIAILSGALLPLANR